MLNVRIPGDFSLRQDGPSVDGRPCGVPVGAHFRLIHTGVVWRTFPNDVGPGQMARAHTRWSCSYFCEHCFFVLQFSVMVYFEAMSPKSRPAAKIVVPMKPLRAPMTVSLSTRPALPTTSAV